MNWYLVLGSGRSGTTWVQDCLANANNLATSFEPLHPAVSLVGQTYAYRCLGEQDYAPDLLAFLKNGPSTITEKLWITYRVVPSQLVPRPSNLVHFRGLATIGRRYEKLVRNYRALKPASGPSGIVLKLIRANLMIAWLRKHLTSNIIYVVRNPVDVVASQYERGISWEPDQRMALIIRNRDVLRRYKALLHLYKKPETEKLEKLAIIWAIENGYAMSSCMKLGVSMVNYEQLKSGERAAWQTMCSRLGLANVPKMNSISEPSLMAFPINNRCQLRIEQIERIKNIIKLHNQAMPDCRLSTTSGF